MQKDLLNGAVKAAFQRNLECLNGTAHITYLSLFYSQYTGWLLKNFTDNILLAPIALENLIDNMGDREACITNSVEQLLNRLIESLRYNFISLIVYAELMD